MSQRPIDPMFAPIPYGDDRQVSRTRRGLYCDAEMQYNPKIVYCKCYSCDYEWQIPKDSYILGTGGTGIYGDYKYSNIGTGGTGDYTAYKHGSYGQYDIGLADCCTGGVGLCGSAGDLAKVADFFPYNSTGGTGDATSVYVVCVGSSGTNSPPVKPRTYGGYPIICPNCCRVNFEARWIETKDNKKLTEGEYCPLVMVIDVQRRKTDYSAG